MSQRDLSAVQRQRKMREEKSNSSKNNLSNSKSPAVVDINGDLASPGSSGIYRPSRRKGQPTPSRFELKDAEQTRLSLLRAKADTARVSEVRVSENKRILEQSKAIIQESVDHQLSSNKNQMHQMHQDKIGRKMEMYMGESVPKVSSKATPKIQGAFMDDELKKEIDRIINQQVDEQMQSQGKSIVKQIVRSKQIEFKSRKFDSAADKKLKDDQQQKIDPNRLQKVVKKQVELTKYLMRNSLDDRVDTVLNKYMSRDWQPSGGQDPLNHNWLDPTLMDYDAQNILDGMIQEQIDSQIQPILSSKIQGIVDIKCANMKANAYQYKEQKKAKLMNQIEQLTLSELQLQQRSLGKIIEDTVKAKMKERIDNDEIGIVSRASSPKKLSRVGTTLNSDLKKEIDSMIGKHIEPLQSQIESKTQELVKEKVKEQKNKDVLDTINEMVDYEIKIQKKGLDSKVQLRVNETIRQYKKNMAPDIEKMVETKFEKKIVPLSAAKQQSYRSTSNWNVDQPVHRKSKPSYGITPANHRQSSLKGSMVEATPPQRDLDSNVYDTVSSPSINSQNQNLYSRRKRVQRTVQKVA